LDAAKRWIEKDKPEKFTAWLEQFYKADHRAFMRKIFAPFIDERVDQMIVEYCELHGEVILKALSNKDDIEFETLTRNWADVAPLQLTEAILNEEMDYE